MRSARGWGFTLLEVVIAAVLIGLVSLTFLAIFGTAQRYLIQGANQVSSQAEASFAVEQMRRRLLPANRVVRYTDTLLAFRFDPRPLGTATPADFSDDQWAGYRLNDDGTLDFLPNVSLGAADPSQAAVSGAAAENPPLARGVVTLQMRLPDITVAPPQTSPPQPGRVSILLEAQQATGGDSRRTRLETVVNPRGILT
ncbi:MAG: hypothetical protein HYZ93_04275 [Candidatus Omnitrophica bacterium]|nr:hypothetical protein [Candidatus Omnitrophota bacterium]